MKEFYEMLRRITSSPYHDQMMKFVRPLRDHFGINHFWYYHVTSSGFYTYIGTHAEWNEYCFEKHLIDQFPCLRHPDTMQSGISLMKNTANVEYKNVLNEAWETFNINFNLNLTKKTSEGIEAFGFATQNNHPQSDEKLLNELPLLRYFINAFRERHKKLFQLVYDNQVNFSAYLGPKFYQNEKFPSFPVKRSEFLRKLSVLPNWELTSREKDILGFIVNGYPASYIARRLSLSKRTVENYIASIKTKLYCDSKVELIIQN